MKDEHQPTPRQILRGIAGLLLAMGLLSAIWAGGYLLLIRLFGDNQALAWPIGLAHFFLTLFVFGLLAGTVGRLFNREGQDFFKNISQAFRQIAQGDFTATVDLGKDGQDHGLAHIAKDFNSMVESLRQMEEMRQDFIATVSHELQSPLTSINGFASALRTESLDEPTRERYLSIIEQQSRRLSRLSDSLLSLTNLESRGLVAEQCRFALDEQIRTVILAAEPQWSRRNLNLDIELESVQLVGDEAALERVWTNLLHNAIKFTPSGGTIRMVLAHSDGRIRFECRDSGIGVSADDLPRLFDRFFKADRSRSQADGNSGSGLGLAIAKKIVELHGGTIIASSPGTNRGCLIEVILSTTA